MGIFGKIFTAIRGGATEAGEAIVDGQALRILDQEIRDAQNALDQAKNDLTKVMAQRKLSADRLSDKESKVGEYTNYAEQALAKNDEALAMELATKIADWESQVAEEKKVVGEYDKSIEMLKAAVKQAEQTITKLKQQVDTVKATESVQRAQASISARYSGTNASLKNAVDSLDRIKQKQTERAAQMEAAQELDKIEKGDDLEDRLKQAGIVPGAGSAQAVLDRLRNKTQN